MKTYTVELTAKDIEVLQIALCAERLNLEEKVDRLECHNKTGINTKLIEVSRERMKDCDRLFSLLYDAENK